MTDAEMNETCARLSELKAGESFTYYRGHISRERPSFVAKTSTNSGPEAHRVNVVARHAWKLYERGRITLVQKRVGPKTCDYIAQGIAR